MANPEKSACVGLVRKAATLIQKAGRQVWCDQRTLELARIKPHGVCSNASELVKEAQLMMVFGGDGTMLRVARAIAGSSTPIVGINAGGLGFLTDVPMHQLNLAMGQIWAGESVLESRSLIEVSGKTHGRRYSMLALNDFVVTRGEAPRLIELEVSVDGEALTRYRCDGLIVCSPTGSTAYSLAAGGAVVSPTAEVFTLTPICPHTLSNRSVIVSLRSKVQVKVLGDKVETILTSDGQTTVPLAPGDIIEIKQSRHRIQLLHLRGSSFFNTLRKKLNWSGSNVP